MKELLRKATLGVVLLLAAVSACADGIRTAQVDGLTWKYVVVDGGATIFGGQFREWDDEEGGYIWAFYPAIPEGTSGAIFAASVWKWKRFFPLSPSRIARRDSRESSV